MSMYVIRVKPGMDCEVAASLRKRGYFIRCPQRTLSIRKDGTWTDRTEPIFSGYLFLESPETLRSESYYDICQADGVLYFLKQGSRPASLSSREEVYIRLLWNKGFPISASRVFVTASGDCMILSGMLRQYEGDSEHTAAAAASESCHSHSWENLFRHVARNRNLNLCKKLAYVCTAVDSSRRNGVCNKNQNGFYSNIRMAEPARRKERLKGV